MTRKALIELIQRRLKFTDSKKQFPALYVEGALDIVWQQLCVQTYSEKFQDINYYAKKYSAVSLTEDTGLGLYYMNLPEEMIRLPRIGEGVISINQINSRGSDFKPLREQDFRLMTSQEVFRIGGYIYYYVDYDQVFFGESLTSEIATAGVDLNLCIPFSKYDIDELLPLPAGQSQIFVDMAINYLSGTPVVNTDNKNEI